MPILERRSAAFRTIDRRISLVAPTDIGVLILGENGTGKEHVAEKIHAQSTRQKGPFVAIDCGMLTRELAASELFGYEKGAFTGAITGKKGCMAELEELIYGLDSMKLVNAGEPGIKELLEGFCKVFGMEIKESQCYNTYADIKRRKNDSRTYFFDKAAEKLNRRMQEDEERERIRKR